jgi:DNA-binding NarL/FixJ family response regulator
VKHSPAGQADAEAAVAAARGALGPVRFEAALASGRDTPLADLRHATVHPRPPLGGSEGLPGTEATATLTAREREVLRLVAQGLSDRQIGARLFISQTTVTSHVKHILAKLGVASRVEATAVAVRRGLV